MTGSIDDYLDQLQITDALRERVVEHQLVAARLCPEELHQAFLSEYPTTDGQRQWTFLHLFSQRYAVEIPNFATSNQMYLVSIEGRIQTLELTRTDFDLTNPTDSSRLVAIAHLSDQFRLEMSASGVTNSAALLELVQARFIPGATRGPASAEEDAVATV